MAKKKKTKGKGKTQAAGLQVEYVALSCIKPHPGNPRTHPPEAIGKLVKSMKVFGWTNPILTTQKGQILAGHARLKAAQDAGLKEVPIIRLPLNSPEAELYMIADNKLQDETEWNWPKLGDLFGECDVGNVDLEASAFDLSDIEGLVNGLDDKSGGEAQAGPKEITCPKCGHKFAEMRNNATDNE